MSRNAIRGLGEIIREKLGFKNTAYIDIAALLEELYFYLGKDEYNYEICEDHEMKKGVEAEYDMSENRIYIRNSVYEDACNGKGRARFTIAHEIAHFFLLNIYNIRLQRVGSEQIPAYMNPEWQADTLAAELLMPYSLTREMGIEEIAQACKVSRPAAKVQFSNNKK